MMSFGKTTYRSRRRRLKSNRGFRRRFFQTPASETAAAFVRTARKKPVATGYPPREPFGGAARRAFCPLFSVSSCSSLHPARRPYPSPRRCQPRPAKPRFSNQACPSTLWSPKSSSSCSSPSRSAFPTRLSSARCPRPPPTPQRSSRDSRRTCTGTWLFWKEKPRGARRTALERQRARRSWVSAAASAGVGHQLVWGRRARPRRRRSWRPRRNPTPCLLGGRVGTRGRVSVAFPTQP
mmetsp:Transcript_2208/g.8497  ORF Transcript_2208/g.8497 Transcript_2208/m.8497 type:complete len:237 (-) Transcript_2208:1558-2268(-)